MADISLTAGMRANLLQLQTTEMLMDRTQQRISTGKKINSALDGPAAYFAAKSLTDRAGDLTSLKDNMGQAISTIKAADIAVTKISDLVSQAKALANTAKQNLGDDATAVASRKSSAAQFDVLMTQIDDMVDDASYAGKNLLLGDGSTITLASAGETTVEALAQISDVAVNAATGADTYDFAVTTGQFGRIDSAWDAAAVETAFNSNTDVNAGVILSDLAITGPLGGTAASYDVVVGFHMTGTSTGDSMTVTVKYDGAEWEQTIADGTLNTAFDVDLQNLNIQFSLDDIIGAVPASATTGTNAEFDVILFDSSTSNHADDQRVTITSTNDTVTGTDGAVTLSSYGDDLTRTAGGTLLEDDTTVSTVFSTGTVQFAVGTLASIGTDAGTDLVTSATTATNLNDLAVDFNADGSSSITVDSINTASAAGLGISGAIGSWAASADITTALTQIDAALSTLRDTGQTLSTNLSVVQTREDFTNEFINTLEEGADKWTLADSNLEGANMLMLQTRQQLGTVSLSIASQSAQSILRLFG